MILAAAGTLQPFVEVPGAMALTPSTMLPLGTPLPQALLERERDRGALEEVVGRLPSAGALAERPVLVLFLSCHCPFVKHIEAEITRLQKDLGDQAVLLGIASNSFRTHPQDGPEGMAAQAATHGWTFPYLLDRDQAVARAFQAACTPDLFLFDRAHRLAYRGQLDPSRPGNDLPCDGRDLRAALAAVLADQPVSEPQIASIGCNIKWHPGAAPAWAR
jgi:thiol-disulfide isomerase/thioredoxin